MGSPLLAAYALWWLFEKISIIRQRGTTHVGGDVIVIAYVALGGICLASLWATLVFREESKGWATAGALATLLNVCAFALWQILHQSGRILEYGAWIRKMQGG